MAKTRRSALRNDLEYESLFSTKKSYHTAKTIYFVKSQIAHMPVKCIPHCYTVKLGFYFNLCIFEWSQIAPYKIYSLDEQIVYHALVECY